jgi:hypothetical protein
VDQRETQACVCLFIDHGGTDLGPDPHVSGFRSDAQTDRLVIGMRSFVYRQGRKTIGEICIAVDLQRGVAIRSDFNIEPFLLHHPAENNQASECNEAARIVASDISGYPHLLTNAPIHRRDTVQFSRHPKTLAWHSRYC